MARPLDSRRDGKVRWCAALLSALASVSCLPNARWYDPAVPAKGQGPGAELEATVIRRESAHTIVVASVRPLDLEAYGPPRVTAPDAPPCTSGEPASTWSVSLTEEPTPLEPRPHGTLNAQFVNSRVDGTGLLLRRPTVLDVPMTTLAGSNAPVASCVRLPLLRSGGGEIEWRQRPHFWSGLALRVEVPLHPLWNDDGLGLIVWSLGAFLGPVRAGIELGYGNGFGSEVRTRTNEAFVLEAGVRVGSPVLAIGRFGTGVEFGYEQEGWSYGPDPVTGVDVASTVRGLRAALRFLLLPAPPPSQKYDFRADSWSTGLEVSAALLYATADGSQATAIGGSWFGDMGW